MGAREIIAQISQQNFKDADRILSALDAAGFQIVPKEPTLEPHNDPGITGYRLPLEPREDLELQRDAAIKAHDDMKECLGRKLKEAIAERDALLAEVERLDGELRFVVNLIDANPNAYGSDLQDCLMHPRAAQRGK